jgi:hypothetical protein
MTRYYPSQQELHAPDKLERVLRDTYDRIYKLSTQMAVQDALNKTASKVAAVQVITTPATSIASGTSGTNRVGHVTITAVNYTAQSIDNFIQVTAAGVVISLLSAVTHSGEEYVIDNNSTGDITIVPSVVGQTLQGETTQTLSPNDVAHVYADGTNWRFS